jgi:hypothetical protein
VLGAGDTAIVHNPAFPINADDLSGIELQDADLMYYNGEAWLLAVTANTQTPPPGNRHEDIDTAEPTLNELVSYGLGHHGVY